MTPEKASELLDHFGSGTEVEYYALQTIANMTAEYAVERDFSAIAGDPDWEKINFSCLYEEAAPEHDLDNG